MIVEAVNKAAVILPFILALGGIAFFAFVCVRLAVHISRSFRHREITKTQTDQLLRLLANMRGQIGFITRFMDTESLAYGQALANTFRQAGWNVAPFLRTSMNDFPGYVVVAGAGPADTVANALNTVGIDCRLQQIPPNTIAGALQANTIYVVIGRKK